MQWRTIMEPANEMKFDNPEILSGIPGIRWVGYEPSGGNMWHEEYVKNLLPKIDEALVELREIAAAYEREKSRISSLSKCIKEIQRIADKVREVAGGDATAGSLGPRVSDWLAATVRLSEPGLPFTEFDSDGLQKTNEDIKFLMAFKEYVETDFMLDRTLYALYQVDDRYKMKLFRYVLKVLRKIDSSRAIIKNSKSLLNKYLADGGFAGLFEMMDTAYEKLSIGLKKLKKLVDRQGVSAIDATELAGRDVVKEARQLFAGTAA